MSLKKPFDMRDQTHLFNRDGTYYFRARIPADLLPHLSPKREVVTSLRTKDKTEAKRLVSAMVLQVQQEWDTLRRSLADGPRRSITEGEIQQLVSLMVESRLQHDEDARLAGLSEEAFNEADAILADLEGRDRAAIARGDFSDRGEVVGLSSIALPAGDWLQAYGFALPPDSPDYRRFLMEFAKGSRRASDMLRQRQLGEPVDTPKAAPWVPVEAPSGAPATSEAVPLLSAVLADFMGRHDPKQPIMKKYGAVLPMFAEVVGDVPVSQLRQKAVTDFFDLIQGLPPRWADKRKQLGKTVQELAAMAWPECMAEKTFDDTYKMAVRSFFKFARLTYGDAGWPDRLTTEGIKYRGDEEEGKNRQRPMLLKELQRLFSGPEAAAFAADTSQASAFWLPLLGLYTGARVNELCQLNPQCDIRNDDPQAPGVWFLDITEEGEAAEGVDKSVKNEISQRRVPVHSALLALGFVEYVKGLKKAGSALLFPLWAPSKGRAAGGAEKWFRGHLEALGLRDETRGARLVGFHAFRSTFMARAEEINEPRADAISGHAREGESKVKRNYRRETPLSIKVEILERITFDVSPPMPVKPPG